MERYEKVQVIGRGAHGICHLCRRKDDKNREKVVVKTVSLEGLGEKGEEAIMGEVRVLRMLRHPNIIRFHESFRHEGALNIVMHYAEGGTLERLIHEQKQPFQENRVMYYFTQIVMALDFMHSKQILHRDLKTQNILLNRRQTMVMLSDFGISKQLTMRSVASTVVGTPNYLSPEICEGRPYNQKSDIWSLGCVLFELVELRRAFEGENLSSIVLKVTKGNHNPISDRVSQQVRILIERMFNLNEKERPSVKEILTEPIVLHMVMHLNLDMGRISPMNPLTSGCSTYADRRVAANRQLRTTPAAASLK
ncbi:hypothetical protein QR680_010319 [Steinernema hermaphroditum]|uniref:non-specific serine/threonine protein kinase n=1 Tax=Steinernema hermaphroditum TaxID=289476 RepID=A0AA39IPT0_9BILA|nr:hypothetical protein QR680_010319 [Steinernema hermaphroditum]